MCVCSSAPWPLRVWIQKCASRLTVLICSVHGRPEEIAAGHDIHRRLSVVRLHCERSYAVVRLGAVGIAMCALSWPLFIILHFSGAERWDSPPGGACVWCVCVCVCVCV